VENTGATAAQHATKSVNPATWTQRTIKILSVNAAPQRRSAPAHSIPELG
jgi:hypothetical protein